MKDFVSKVMAVGAIIVWALCFILGLVTLLLGSIGTAIGLWVSGFIGGCVYLALDQILSGQDAILENQKKLFALLESLKQPSTPEVPPAGGSSASPAPPSRVPEADIPAGQGAFPSTPDGPTFQPVEPGKVKCLACGRVQREGRSVCYECGQPFKK